MIHQVHSDGSVAKRLKEVVRLQHVLLRYAVGTKLISQSGCELYLSNIPAFKGRAGKIADWLWKGVKPRSLSLERFAKGPYKGKRNLLHRVIVETHYFASAVGYIRALALPENDVRWASVPDWQKGAWEFLGQFYKEIKASDSTGFPPYIFTSPGDNSFKRQEFLTGFMSANKGLYVCSICDESGYFTTTNTGKGEVIRAEIDHYLPISYYPHLSCHPLNLVSICHQCNAWVKSNTDPLRISAGERRALSPAILPYHHEGLAEKTYLRLDISKALKNRDIGKIEQRPNLKREELIDILNDVYQVPGRWGGRVDQIGETLFRRMRQFLRHASGMPLGAGMSVVIRDALDQLLFYLSDKTIGDSGKDPFSFAMTWWLAVLINEEIEPSIGKTLEPHSLPPVLEEIVTWFGEDVSASSARATVARNLRSIAK